MNIDELDTSLGFMSHESIFGLVLVCFSLNICIQFLTLLIQQLTTRTEMAKHHFQQNGIQIATLLSKCQHNVQVFCKPQNACV